MSKKSGQKRTNRSDAALASRFPQIKRFRPLSWYGRLDLEPMHYVTHLFQELGRLGLDIHAIEWHDRAPNRQTVLSDLVNWLEGEADSALAHLMNWQHLDLARMTARVQKNRNAKPRIEISASITKMNNLSVCWHPGGWRSSWVDWNMPGGYPNLMQNRRWEEPPDFWWFVGDEEPTFQSRATNELMFIRGVGHLDPDPLTRYGPFLTYNRDVVESILICAVRSAYERLVAQLELSFEVTVVDAFDFDIREEKDADDQRLYDGSIQRVVSWRLEDAQQLRIRRQQAEEAEKERKERQTLNTLMTTYGCSLETVIQALVVACSSRRRARAVSQEIINRDVAKSLRTGGARVNAGDVRRIRELIEKYQPETLPAVVREPVASASEDTDRLESNVEVSGADCGGERCTSVERSAPPPEGAPESVHEVEVPMVSVAVAEAADRESELQKGMATLGCTLEAFVEALVRAHSRQSLGQGRSDEDANREAAKELRGCGVPVDTEGVRRLRRMIERCRPQMLEEQLRPKADNS